MPVVSLPSPLCPSLLCCLPPSLTHVTQWVADNPGLFLSLPFDLCEICLPRALSSFGSVIAHGLVFTSSCGPASSMGLLCSSFPGEEALFGFLPFPAAHDAVLSRLFCCHVYVDPPWGFSRLHSCVPDPPLGGSVSVSRLLFTKGWKARTWPSPSCSLLSLSFLFSSALSHGSPSCSHVSRPVCRQPCGYSQGKFSSSHPPCLHLSPGLHPALALGHQDLTGFFNR